MYIDTHCHLNMMVHKQPNEPVSDMHLVHIGEIVSNAHNAGVGMIINVGTGEVESANSVTIARQFPSVYATVGIHPGDCGQYQSGSIDAALAPLKKLLDHAQEHKIIAVGEIGLDFFHQPYDKQQQIDFFKAQIELAGYYNLPIVVHIRHAADDVLKVLESYRVHKVRGVMHCFLQDETFARTILSWGFYVGLDAPITYPKNDNLRLLFGQIPLDRILLETDAPFLPPQLYRGKQNTPAYIPLIAQALAAIRGIDCSVVEHATTTNAQKLFFGKDATHAKI